MPSAVGSFAFTAQVSDASGASALGAFSVAIASPTLAFPTVLLPSAIAGVPYPPQILTAFGGAPPYTYSVQGSGLLTGLSLSNGVISGVPNVSGTSNFTIKVTDSAQAAASAGFQIVVRNSSPPDLVPSVGQLAFTLDTGAVNVPDPQSITVASSDVTTLLSYQLSVSPAAPWLSVAGGLNGSANTPGGISVALASQALTLGAAGSPYTTNLTLTCMAPSPCAGSSQKIIVTLNVSSPPPQLLITKTSLDVSSGTGIFGISNAGGGAITVNSISAADGWLTLANVPQTLSPESPVYVTASASLSGVQPGLYHSTIFIVTSAGTVNLPVTALVNGNPTISLNPVGQQFQMTAKGAPGNPGGSFQVLSTGTSPINWSASSLPGANWLLINSTTGSSTSSTPGSVAFSIDPVASSLLAAGTYYGTVRVTSTQVINTPEDFLVVLTVAPAGTLADPDPEPSGLLFIANGSTAVAPQTITVYAGSTASVPYQAAALTQSGTQWLSVSPTTGSASAAAPGHPTISVNPSGLAPGVYRGVVTYQFSPASVRSVNVTYIVPTLIGGLPFARQLQLGPQAGGNCTPSNLVATGAGLASNFAQPVSWPTLIAVLVTDDCGTPVTNAQVDVTFSNGDPPLPLIPNVNPAGRYAATWTPRGAVQQVTVTATAIASGFPTAKAQITGKITPNLAPALTPGATLNVFNPVSGGGIAPGTAVQIYGSNFAPPGTSALAMSLPFPTSMQNTSVLIGGVQAPLYYVSPGQINAQAPFELMPGVPYQIVVSANGALTTPDRLVAAPAAPGIAAFPNGAIIAQHLDSTLVTETSPAKPGEIIAFYLAGLGSAANQPADGNPSPVPPTDPLSPVTVNISGSGVQTIFVGLTPGTVGLYQIDLTVPPGTPDGDQILTILQGSVVSNVTTLPVHH